MDKYDHTPLAKLTIFAVLSNLAIIILGVVLKSKFPPQIPLFYGMAEGEEQLAGSSLILLPNLVSLIIIVINFLFSFLTKDDLLKKTLIFSGMTATILATITVVKISLLVGNF